MQRRSARPPTTQLCLSLKRADGKAGWENPKVCSVEDLWRWLLQHVPKRDAVDVGNFAMMIWNRQRSAQPKGEQKENS